MKEELIIPIAVVAGVVIFGLIAVNVLLIRWVCKRNKDAQDAETRMSVLASNVRCTTANDLPRKSRRSDVKYVSTSVTKHTKGPKKPYVNTDEMKRPKADNVNTTLTEYGDGYFDTLKRDDRESCEPLNDYGQVRLGTDGGEYDTAFFRNKKEETLSDSVYACVDKSKKKKALKSANDSEYGHPKQRNASNDQPGTLPRRCYLESESGKEEVQDTGYEVSYIGNESESNKNSSKKSKQGSSAKKLKKSEVMQVNDKSKDVDEKGTKDIQTEDSFLQKQKIPDSGNSQQDRKSACTQVEDMDFTLNPNGHANVM